jgi:hypothetical protein
MHSAYSQRIFANIYEFLNQKSRILDLCGGQIFEYRRRTRCGGFCEDGPWKILVATSAHL